MGPGHERAIPQEELLRQLGWVESLAGHLLGDPNAAADVTQDAWLKLHQRPDVRGAGSLRWLARVTRSLVRERRRASRRRSRRERDVARSEAQPSTYDVVERNALQQRVSEAVMALDEPYRSTILHRYLDDLTTAEIAERMGVSAAAVRQRLSRGRSLLRARFERELGPGQWTQALLAALPSEHAATAATAAPVAPIGGGLLVGAKVIAAAALVAGAAGAAWHGLARPTDIRTDARVLAPEPAEQALPEPLVPAVEAHALPTRHIFIDLTSTPVAPPPLAAEPDPPNRRGPRMFVMRCVDYTEAR